MGSVSVPILHRVHIEGFRTIQDPLELDLRTPGGDPSRTVVVAGPNGSGKTSVLEAILLGLGLDRLISRDVPSDIEQTDASPVRMPKGARIEIDVSIDGMPPETWVRTSRAHVSVDAGRVRGQSQAPTVERALAVEYFSSWRAPRLVGPVKPLISGRLPGEAEADRLWRLKQRIIDQRSRRAYHAQIPGVESREEVWLRKLNEAWTRFHQGDGTSIDAQIADPDAEDLYADLYIMKAQGRLCSIDQASSGEIELLSLMGWMILSDFTSGILLIDEPELHLHPRWQATVLPALRQLAPEAQILVASHADAPWDQVFSFERFLLPMIPGAADLADPEEDR